MERIPAPTESERLVMERWGMEVGRSRIERDGIIVQEINTVYYILPDGWSVVCEHWDAGDVYYIIDSGLMVRVSWRGSWIGADESDIHLTVFTEDSERMKYEKPPPKETDKLSHSQSFHYGSTNHLMKVSRYM